MIVNKFLVFIIPVLSYNYQLRSIYHHGVVKPQFLRMDFSEADMHAEQEGSSDMVLSLPVSGHYRKKPIMLADIGGSKRQKHMGGSRGRQTVFNRFKTEHYIPDLSNKTNLINIAKIAYNAYSTPIKEDWFNLTSDYDLERSFGWENDGVRGHVFSSHDNSTIILGFKGTSAAIVSGDSPTSGNDKLNDNRMFSCCCARIDPTWYTVCDCYKGNSTCGNMCVEKAMDQNDMYFDTAQAILFAVLDQYPTVRNIWLTGHSLGGGLAALLGLTFDLPVVTFQSPGDLLAAQRLHLPLPEEDRLKDLPIWHFGHTADPIYMGKCNGVLSTCYIAGYALETGCHTGSACTYDTVKDFKWSPDIRRHRLGVVIDEVLSVYNDTAECKPQTNCTDCTAWSYLEED